jgi:hypothetical protein
MVRDGYFYGAAFWLAAVLLVYFTGAWWWAIPPVLLALSKPVIRQMSPETV